MYLILFDKNKQANCIVPTGNITKDDVYLFDSLPPFEPIEGYANSLHLTESGELEWNWAELPPSPPYEEDATEEDYKSALNALGVSTDEEV